VRVWYKITDFPNTVKRDEMVETAEDEEYRYCIEELSFASSILTLLVK
jgi:hypothetical protein